MEKQGCSKSLSIELIFKSMKFKNSDNPFFKTLNKLIMNSSKASKINKNKTFLTLNKYENYK